MLPAHRQKDANLELRGTSGIVKAAKRERTVAHGARNNKKGRGLLCQGNRIKYGFIREQQKTYPVTVLCRVMAVSTSAYYAWLRTPEDTDKARRKAALEAKARQLFNDHKQTYGYQRLSDALDKAGMKSGHYQVRHLMARLGLGADCHDPNHLGKMRVSFNQTASKSFHFENRGFRQATSPANSKNTVKPAFIDDG